MRTCTLIFLNENWNIQWFHIQKEIQISVIHSSSNTHSPVSLTVSPSLLLIHSLTLSIFHLSLISHLQQSHQLLLPRVHAHNLYILSTLLCVKESNINCIFPQITSTFTKVILPVFQNKFPTLFYNGEIVRQMWSVVSLPHSDIHWRKALNLLF